MRSGYRSGDGRYTRGPWKGTRRAREHRVLIVGGGFGGLYAARELGKDDRVDLTVVDRRTFHLFTPLLYQVATGAVSPGDIAQPLRRSSGGTATRRSAR